MVRRRPNQGENEWLVWKWDTGSTETTYKDGYAQTLGEYYMYRVRALRGDEYSKMSNRVDVRRPEAAPETTAWAPSNLQALVYGKVTLGEEGVTTQVRLTWDAPAEGVEWIRGYEVQRATCDGGFTTLVADTGSTATAYTDAEVEAGESYTYRVRARRPQGLSLTSNRWTVLIPGGDGTGACALAAGAGTVVIPNYEFLLSTHDQDTVLVKNTGQTLGTALALNSTFNRRAQEFTTGTYTGGYTLSSIGISFNAIADTSTAGSQLTVTLNGVAGNGNPGDALCTLSDPGSFTASAVNTFDAPTTCPTLSPSTTYFAVIERAGATSSSIDIASTGSSSEDAGGATGWSIGDDLHYRQSGQSWNKTTSESYQIEVSGALGQEFNTLGADGVTSAYGIWSDGTTMWVAHRPEVERGYTSSAKLFAYNMSTKQRDSTKDFNTLDAAGNDNPRGLWSDGSIMWVVDQSDEKIYAYDMDTKARVPSRDFNSLARVNEDDEDPDAYPVGIWSDGDIMWVADNDDEKIYAYDLNTKARVRDEDFNGLVANNSFPAALWGDETTLFVSDSSGEIYAYWRSNKAPNAARYISLCCGNAAPFGIWSDGSTMWVSDEEDDKIYAYALPDVVVPPETLLSMERVTDTMALVKVDVQALVRQFGSEEPAVSVKVLGTLSGATMYVHPSASYARFLLLGLRPETQYTVIASYGVETRYPLGDAGREVFRTDYARLAGIETSGLTHTEATVTVSLAGADVDGRCCFRWYPHSNGGEAEPEYTYYLRHKASDDTVWSDPVELTFSDFTAEARLTGLDPGAAYDVEVGESPTFMPPQGSAGSYEGTMTVGNDGGVSGIGFDQLGFSGVFDPYGSISPTTFKLGGVDHSIVELRVGVQSFLIPPDQAGKLFLTFDKALPEGAGFTLTLGTTEFNSSDATVSERTYNWDGGPSLSNNASVSVELDFTMVGFREGTTLEELGAFTTPTMPPTLAFEAEMTVGTTPDFDGYYAIVDPPTGSISSNTFEVGGVQYTVRDISFEKGTNLRFVLDVTPALPYDSFTLTLDGTVLLSGDATVTVNDSGSATYYWSGRPNPNWASGSTVDVKLDIGLIDICDRSQVVADAIVAATLSYDFCHMVSPFDLPDITELDLTGKSGYGLKAGDFAGLSGLEILNLSGYSLGGHTWNQLPVGLFDGLDNLEVLDLSDTNLLNLNRGIFGGLSNLVELDLSDTLLDSTAVPVGVFDGLDSLEILRIANAGYRGRGIKFVDEDIFRGLNTLRELDVRPIRPHDDVLAPLTNLETLNGQNYTP